MERKYTASTINDVMDWYGWTTKGLVANGKMSDDDVINGLLDRWNEDKDRLLKQTNFEMQDKDYIEVYEYNKGIIDKLSDCEPDSTMTIDGFGTDEEGKEMVMMTINGYEFAFYEGDEIDLDEIFDPEFNPDEEEEEDED